MESFQRLVRSLKSARSVELPSDVKAAYFMLLSYIMQNDHRTVTDLLTTNTEFDVNFFSGKYGRTLLHTAANVGAYECLCQLLKRGAKPDTFDRQGITPLQVAARNGFTRCIVKLLEYGANITTKNNEGMTAIHWLASNGRTEVLSEIKKYLIDIDIEDENGQTPLHVASLNGHSSTVIKLIELNADIEKKDAHGCTPILFACRHGQTNVVKELLDAGAKLQKSHDGESALLLSLKGGYGKVCFQLIERYPELLEKLMRYCQRKDVERSKIVAVLTFICSKHPNYRNKILFEFSKIVCAEGLELMSQVPDTISIADSFLNFIRIFNSLSAYGNSESSEQQRLVNSAAAILRSPSVSRGTFDISPPENLEDIKLELDMVWKTMEQWLFILQNEINSCENQKRSTASPEDIYKNKNRESSGSSSFARCSRSYLLSSISKTSVNLEQLRLTQPAYAVNKRDDDYSQAYFSRSESYVNALSGVSDNFEKNLTKENFEMTPEHSLKLDAKLIDSTADKLCGAIHGYHLYCSTNPCWDKTNDKKIAFAQFLEKHEEVLLMLVSRKTQLIFDHFSFLLENPILLQRFLPVIHVHPLEQRREWFYEKLYNDEKRTSAVFDEESVIHVTRESILQSSCKELNNKNGLSLKNNVSIRFQGEQGMGAGVTREWLDLLVKEMLNPDFALFTLSADGSTFQPNSCSAINPDHLSYFRFAGKVMGLALYHKHLITAYFTRSFYKHILGIPVNYKDVESIDPVYSKNLQTILDNNIDDLGLDIPFSVETNVFGEIQEVELKPNGKNIVVNDANKLEYVNLAADVKMTKSIKAQILAFLEGFYQFVPHSLVSLFNEYELELLLSGVPDIDIEDWRKNALYQSGYLETDEIIKWFWEVVGSYSKEKQVQLLQFVTGTSRVPWGGFANLGGATGNQQFTICLQAGAKELLPTASTCFNMLKLPEYESKEELDKKLSLAIECGTHGFEFT